MNSNLLNFLITMVLAIILATFLPWWSVMVTGFISGVIFNLKSFKVFLVPFLAIFTYWVIYAFYLSSANDFILAKKIATLLPLNGNAYALIIITGVVGGIASGVAGILGKQCASIIKK